MVAHPISSSEGAVLSGRNCCILCGHFCCIIFYR